MGGSVSVDWTSKSKNTKTLPTLQTFLPIVQAEQVGILREMHPPTLEEQIDDCKEIDSIKYDAIFDATFAFTNHLFANTIAGSGLFTIEDFRQYLLRVILETLPSSNDSHPQQNDMTIVFINKIILRLGTHFDGVNVEITSSDTSLLLECVLDCVLEA